MYEQFSNHARAAIHLGQERARKLGHNWLGIDHILYGICEEDSGIGVKALRNLGIEPAAILEKLQAQQISITENPNVDSQARLPNTPYTRSAIEKAIAAARVNGDSHVGTSHLLAAICQLRDESKSLVDVLPDRAEEIIAEIIRLQLVTNDKPEEISPLQLIQRWTDRLKKQQGVPLNDIITTVKQALPGEDASTRSLFLVGYLVATKKISCPLDAFDNAAEAFLKSTGISSDAWETILAAMVQTTMVDTTSMDKFRNYIGLETAPFKAGTAAPDVARPAPQEFQAEIKIAANDMEILRGFSKYTKKVPGITADHLLLELPKISQEHFTLEVRSINAEGGPVLVGYAFDKEGTCIATSQPTKDPAAEIVLHLVNPNPAAPDIIYHVLIKQE